jgi:SecD/SecF fusion protein
LYEYLPTFFHFVANKVKNDAKAFAAGNSDKEARYLIPLGRKTYLILDLQISTLTRLVISKSKGLDLEGGINVILQISVKIY